MISLCVARVHAPLGISVLRSFASCAILVLPCEVGRFQREAGNNSGRDYMVHLYTIGCIKLCMFRYHPFLFYLGQVSLPGFYNL
ncbi:hypothetical protein FKM82_008567 [Ascaphus truei]